MNADPATRAWLKAELTALLGFPEVDDILSYILTEFKTADEVEPYLTEMLGVPLARAKTISSRLYDPSSSSSSSSSSSASAPTIRDSVKKTVSQNESKNKNKSTPSQQDQAAPLVPVPAAANSRLKQTKSKKPSKLLHARIINCLQCGRIEHNGARRCAFCDTELRYEELDDESLMDPAAQEHMRRLVAFDESGAERTTVLDTEQVLYDQVQVVAEGERHRQPIVLNLNLDNRSFESAETPAFVLTANQELHKDARDLLQSIQKKLAKGQRGGGGGGGGGSERALPTSGEEGVVIEDEYNALFV